MPGEKEINVNLFNVLDLLERLEIADKDEKLKEQIAFEKKCIERKLYQKPPVATNN